jgi:hypothetical protein
MLFRTNDGKLLEINKLYYEKLVEINKPIPKLEKTFYNKYYK